MMTGLDLIGNRKKSSQNNCKKSRKKKKIPKLTAIVVLFDLMCSLLAQCGVTMVETEKVAEPEGSSWLMEKIFILISFASH